MGSMIPRRDLQTSLAVNYLEMPQEGGVLAASMEISGNSVDFTEANQRRTANLAVVAVVFNAEGKRLHFLESV